MIWHLRRASWLVRLASILLAAALLAASAACGSQTPTPTLTPTVTTTVTPTPTRVPTITPTPEPVGSESNPLVIGFVSEAPDPQLEPVTLEVARRMSDFSRIAINARIFSSYNDLLDEITLGRVHAAWLPPLTYLYGSQKGLVEVVMLTNHFGVYQYGTQFLANVESGFTPYFDPVSGLTSEGPYQALGQFENRRPCFIDPSSPSGYIVPAGLLKSNAVNTFTPIFIQDHAAVIRALYIKGICDFGATFSISGDPRTSSAVLGDLPDAMNRVLIIWRSDPVIPNLNVSIIAGLPARQRQAVVDSLAEIARTEEGRALLSAALSNYSIDDLKGIDDTVYDPMRVFVDALDLDPANYIGK